MVVSVKGFTLFSFSFRFNSLTEAFTTVFERLRRIRRSFDRSVYDCLSTEAFTTVFRLKWNCNLAIGVVGEEGGAEG